jgi:hypothetical protein
MPAGKTTNGSFGLLGTEPSSANMKVSGLTFLGAILNPFCDA